MQRVYTTLHKHELIKESLADMRRKRLNKEPNHLSLIHI